MKRRNFLAALAAGALAASRPAPKVIAAGVPGAAQPRTTMGVGIYSFSHPKPAYEFLEYCHGLGAGGVQAELASLDADYSQRVRRRAEELGMYLEVVVGLPRGDANQFERAVVAAKNAGAVCLRSACLEGRRYEDFANFPDWQRFVGESKNRLARAVPVLEKHRMALALENHKDWTTDEMVALLEEYRSEFLGVCLDTGNNLALLDEPMETVERLAPFALSTHIKDMAVEEYAEGFQLVEVPLGEGMLDMKRISGTIQRARPATKFTLEMITRNPLKIPCLTEKYWTTFPERNGKFLAETLALVRRNKPRQPLPQVGALDAAARARLEDENVRKCLDYARDVLGLH